MNNVEYKKLRSVIRYKLQGMAKLDKRYITILKAFNLAEEYHCNKRKNGEPEFSHMLMIVAYLLTIHDSLENAPMIILAALWHNLYEDYHTKCPLLIQRMKDISKEGFEYAVKLSKIRNGQKITYEQYFKEMSECPICSVVKLADRASNISTMKGVFNTEKQNKYLQDLIDWFFPMLKNARRLFPEQEEAYENIKIVLITQRDTILAMKNKVEFKKLRSTIRYKLQGMAQLDKRYITVLKAFDLAEEYHCGERKDGQHEFSHMLTIVGYLLTIHNNFYNAPMVILAALWHDLYEDYHTECDKLIGRMKAISEDGFLYAVKLSKIRDGKKISYKQYFSEMSQCIICSIVKLADRMANIGTMQGAFDINKQDGYLQDLIDWFFPMLKKAKRLFPEQEQAYENIKTILTVQRDTIVKSR